MGELIGRECRSSDDVTLGRVVYVERDGSGDPTWIDVALTGELADEHGGTHDRVRLSAGHVEGWDGQILRLGRTLEELPGHWTSVPPETVPEPTF